MRNREILTRVGVEMEKEEQYSPEYDRVNHEFMDIRCARYGFEKITPTEAEKTAWNALRNASGTTQEIV